MRVLIIEDSERLRKSISLALKKTGYAIDGAADGEEGCWLAETASFDVIILDLMLPKMDGITLLKRIRSQGVETHVLILTARGAVEDRINGLEAGADDYLSKPFSIDELLARVAALVRRKYGRKNPDLSIGNLKVDLNRHEARVEGKVLHLAPREYNLLEYLCVRAGCLVTRSEIEDHMYEETSEIFSNAVDSTISLLRRKMAEAGCSPKILTKRGRGYLLENEMS